MNSTNGSDFDEQKTTALSWELSEFLLELSICIHRYAMYPPDHPALEEAGEKIRERLQALFLFRSELSIGVAQDQLVIEGVATDSKHPVLGDLARRLHDHQLGAVSFRYGATEDEIVGLMKALSGEAERTGEPLGLLPEDQIPQWENVRIHPLGYDKLEYRSDGSEGEMEPDRASLLWLGLARAAMSSDEELDPDHPPGPEAVASSIQSHRREVAYDQVIVGYFLQLAKELKESEGPESRTVRKRVSDLVRALDEHTLSRIVELGGTGGGKRNFLLDANQSLAVDSVIKILRAAAAASQREISRSLINLLSKLSLHAESGSPGVRDQADQAFRENVEELLRDWELEDPNPDRYSLTLDAMAQSTPVFGPDLNQDALAGPLRLLQMSLELDVWGPTVARAVDDLVDQGQLEYLLDLLETAPRGNQAAEVLRQKTTGPDQFRALLDGEDVNDALVRGMAENMGTSSIPILLDILSESESRSVRRRVFDILTDVGEALSPFLMERFDEDRWYVIRNLLALVQRLNAPPPGFSARPFLEHEDARIRREAFPLALQDPGLREEALRAGLTDSDDRILRITLGEIQSHLPDSLLPLLVDGVMRFPLDPDLRAMAIRALGASQTETARDELLNVCTAGRSHRKSSRLANPSPGLFAALQALSRRWESDPLVAPVLASARSSKNREIREAAAPPAVSGPPPPAEPPEEAGPTEPAK